MKKINHLYTREQWSSIESIELPNKSHWKVTKYINPYICEAQCSCGRKTHPQIFDLVVGNSLMCEACMGKSHSREKKELTQEVLVEAAAKQGKVTHWTLIKSHSIKSGISNWRSLVRCSCGDAHHILNIHLRSGNSVMCTKCRIAQKEAKTETQSLRQRSSLGYALTPSATAEQSLAAPSELDDSQGESLDGELDVKE